MKSNVCYFMPNIQNQHSIHVINLVFETEHMITKALQSKGLFRIHYVYSGVGKLCLPDNKISVKKGDIFFTFPDTSFYVDPASKDFSYMYISYTGTRANIIMEKIGISKKNYLINECEKVKTIWEEAVTSKINVSGWMSESVLLYTFSYLAARFNLAEKGNKRESHLPDLIKKYLDDNFANEKISLELLSSTLSYSPKYISSVFKKHFGTGISDYLAIIRVQYACNLMSQGYTVISEIASMCGFGDALYFSKVFKQKYGMSAKKFIETKTEFFHGNSGEI